MPIICPAIQQFDQMAANRELPRVASINSRRALQTMAQAIRGKVPLVLKLVFELRYRQGYTYLDRCGRTINLIQEYYPDWVVATAAQPNPQNAGMWNVSSGTKFNFSSLKLDLSLDRPMNGDLTQDDLAQFATESENLTAIVIDQLGLADFARIGCRIWHLFPVKSVEEGRQFIQSLNLFSVSPDLSKAFSGNLEGASIAVNIDAADRKFRVTLDAVERAVELDLGEAVINIPVHALPSKDRLKALLEIQRKKSVRQKFSPAGAVIDVDSFRDEPKVVKAGEFVGTSIQIANDALFAATSPTGG